MTNQEWIGKGNTGCTFATLFSKHPDKVGWRFMTPQAWSHHREYKLDLPLIVSIEFPNDGYWDLKTVRNWALCSGMYLEETSENTLGLRIKCKEGVAWVQYFGTDSHVVTRQSPNPMLIYTNKLGSSYYAKVGFNGILHLAHAWYSGMKERVYDLLWDRAHKQTKKKIGHNLTIVEAAKTTYLRDGKKSY